MRQYARAADSAKVNNKPLPKQPLPPTDPAKSNFIAGLYNAMIIPLQPYAIKGVIWYQGESNNGRARQYRTLFPAMIENWRQDWKQGDFPFLFVQIAPHKDMMPEIREAQLLTWQKTPHTAMVVTTDCGDARDIHPTNKQPVGERLALAASALAYGRKLEYSGPVYHSMKRKKHTIELQFTHTGKGLWAKDGPLKGFTIAGADKQFVPANATIKGKKVIVYAGAVREPVAVRYGWANVPDVNFFNKDGLPASPFRTDTE
jgi:sialate O-acetylesterase